MVLIKEIQQSDVSHPPAGPPSQLQSARDIAKSSFTPFLLHCLGSIGTVAWDPKFFLG